MSAKKSPPALAHRHGLFLVQALRVEHAADKDAYKRRNVVERSFNTLKQWRSLAARYDKLALTYRSAVVLHAVIIWSALLVETP